MLLTRARERARQRGPHEERKECSPALTCEECEEEAQGTPASVENAAKPKKQTEDVLASPGWLEGEEGHSPCGKDVTGYISEFLL